LQQGKGGGTNRVSEQSGTKQNSSVGANEMMVIGLMLVMAINAGLYLGTIAYSTYETRQMDRGLTLVGQLARI
jgi:hypothetical protein